MAGAERAQARRRLSGPAAALAAGLALVALPALAAPPGLELGGRFVQGGFAIGRTEPRAEVFVDGIDQGRASSDGLFVVGFDRDAPSQVDIRVRTSAGVSDHPTPIAKGSFDIQRMNGLPRNQVAPRDPALLARIAREVAIKKVGFSSRADLDDFKDGFSAPLAHYRLTARFGGQRILDGEPKRPHYGDDLAAPIGTPVMAPAAGVVSLARTGLHYEGGLIMIDHGQGLISLYLHLSKVAVEEGQMVSRGQVIGAVGKEGRATGPHLCWRLWWRGEHLDPMLMIGAAAP